MPRAKNDISAETLADADKGFAALEVKVEEVQEAAAREAEFPVEDAAATRAAAVEAVSGGNRSESGVAGPPAGAAAALPPASTAAGGFAVIPTAAVQAMWSALRDCAEAGVRLQSETIVSFAQVRSPHDLLAAQVAFGERALGFCTHAMTRVAAANSAWAPTTATLETSSTEA